MGSMFGLGLILNFVDNASAGMSKATQNFNQMSMTADEINSSVSSTSNNLFAMATSLNIVGDTLVRAGSGALSVFTDLSQSVINTGMSLQGYRMQLNALYGDSKKGEQKLQEIKKYAQESVFEVEGLIPAVTMMKTVGIEAMDEVTTSSGKNTQKLLDYASDIAAMVPNMRNTYGTGVKAAMGAIKEYVAEGNAISLKRGAGLDITSILGEDKGSTAEARMKQIADLTEKLNIVGYTANLAGTPIQRLSNMQDALFNSLSKIADSGVFDIYCDMLERVSNFVFELVDNEESFNAITGVLADTINTLLSPLKKLVDYLVDNGQAMVKWIEAHPKLTKAILLTVAAIGALLVAGGLLLKMFAMLGYASAGLSMLKNFGNVLGALKLSFSGLFLKILPLIGLASLFYVAWSRNLFGFRDAVQNTLKDVGTMLSLISDAWSDNQLSYDNFQKAKDLGILPLIEALLDLKYYWGFFIEGVKKGWNSFWDSLEKTFKNLEKSGLDVFGLAEKTGKFLKSLRGDDAEEKWKNIGEIVGQILASSIVILAIISVISKAIKLVSGLIKIGRAVYKTFSTAFKVIRGLRNALDLISKSGAILKIVGLFKDMGAAISLMREGFGFFEVMGAWFPRLASMFSTIGGWFSSIGGALSTLGGWLASAGSAIAGFFSSIASAIVTGLEAIGAALGISVGWVVAIIVAVIALVVLIVVFRKQIAHFFVWLWGVISKFFVDAWNTVSKFFVNIWNAVVKWVKDVVKAIVNSSFVQAIIRIVNTIIKVVKGIVSGIVEIVKSIVNVIVVIAKGIASVVWGVIKVIIAIVQNVWKVIKSIAYAIYQIFRFVFWAIVLALKIVGNFFKSIFNWIYKTIIKPVINAIVTAFNWLWGKIKSILNTIKNFFKTIFNWVYNNVIKPVVDAITTAFEWLWDKIQTGLDAISKFFKKIFDWIKTKVIDPFVKAVQWMWDKIADLFETLGDFIMSIWTPVKDFFVDLFNGIADVAKKAFTWITDQLDKIVGIINKVGDFFAGIGNSIGDFFSGGADTLKGMIGLSTGGYVKETGIAVLHPNEVVVNDDITKKLQGFLGAYENQPPVTSVPVLQQVDTKDKSSSAEVRKSVSSTQLFVNNSNSKEDNDTSTNNDYSVTFEAGSVVIQLSNASDSELEKAAEKLMKIIERKQQLKSMAVRK